MRFGVAHVRGNLVNAPIGGRGFGVHFLHRKLRQYMRDIPCRSAPNDQPRFCAGGSSRLPNIERFRCVAAIIANYLNDANARRGRSLFLEIVGVLLDERFPLRGHFVRREDRTDRTFRHTRSAIDTFVRLDEEHFVGVGPVNAIDRADRDTRFIFYTDTGFGNYKSHNIHLRF